MNYMNFAFVSQLPVPKGGSLIDDIIVFHVYPETRNGVTIYVGKNITKKIRVTGRTKQYPQKAMIVDKVTRNVPGAEEKGMKNTYFIDLPKEFALGTRESIVMYFTVPIELDSPKLLRKHQSRMFVNASIICNGKQELDSFAGEPTHISEVR